MARDLFTNLGSTTVSSGGTTAPSAGTTQSWTVASSSTFPAASSSATPVTQFYVADPALPSELILVTNVSGTTWSVTRGADGTTPVAHTAGFIVRNVVPAKWLTDIEDRAKFSVTRYAADPTGSADSTTAFTNAWADAGSYASTYGAAEVVVPPGKYLIQGRVTMKAGVTMRAYGAYIYGGTDYTGSGSIMFMDTAGSTGYTTGISDVTILGGIYDAKGQNCSTSASGDQNHRDIFCFGNSRNWRFDGCVFRNVPSWHALDVNSVDGLMVTNCRFEGYVDKSSAATRKFSEAIQLDTGSDGTPCLNVTVSGCRMGAALDGSGITTSFGKLVGAHSPSVANTGYHQYIRVIGNHIDIPGDSGVGIYDATDVVIADNHITGSLTDGIHLYGNITGSAARIVVRGNTISEYAIRGISFDGSTNPFVGCVIEGNTLTSSSASAPAIEGVSLNRSVIASNSIYSTNNEGIKLSSSSDTVVEGNALYDIGTTALNIAASCNDCHWVNNKVHLAGNQGIYVNGGANRNMVVGNFVKGASRTTNGANGAIAVSGNTGNTGNVFTANVILKEGSGNEAPAAFVKEGGNSGQADNVFVGNVCKGWGTTKAANVSSTGTVVFDYLNSDTANWTNNGHS